MLCDLITYLSKEASVSDFKLNSSHINELARSFHPKAQVVSVLPDIKQATDLQEVLLKNPNGTFTRHQMIEGAWRKQGTDGTYS
jgi:hypothetical protein